MLNQAGVSVLTFYKILMINKPTRYQIKRVDREVFRFDYTNFLCFGLPAGWRKVFRFGRSAGIDRRMNETALNVAILFHSETLFASN